MRARPPRPVGRDPVRAVLLAGALILVAVLVSDLIGLALLVLLAAIVAVPLSAAADRLERLHVPRGVGDRRGADDLPGHGAARAAHLVDRAFVEGNLVSPLIMARADRLRPALVAAGASPSIA